MEHVTLRRRPVRFAAALSAAALGLYVGLSFVFPFVYGGFWTAACDAAGSGMACNPFLQRGLTTGLFIGIAGPLIGGYLVNRQMALIGEALAHTAFAGVAIGLFLGTFVDWLDYPLLAALVVAALAALGLQYLAEHTDVYGDVPIAILLTGSFALGIAIISYGVAFGRTVESYLFGSILTVTFGNVQLMAALSALVVGVVALTHKQLLFITFDREAARLARVNVRLYDTLLVVLTALVVVASMQILGAILVAAMLVVPVAAAMQLTDGFNRMLVGSVLVGEVAVLAGVVLSYVWEIATGAMIVLVAIAIYLGAVVAGSA
jgi:zinc transport system permease protein